MADEDLLAGSIVDGLWRISTGGGNNSNGLMGNVTDWQRLFKYIGQDQLGTLLAPGYNWNNGGNGAFDINTVSDLTGLSIVPAGQIYSTGCLFHSSCPNRQSSITIHFTEFSISTIILLAEKSVDSMIGKRTNMSHC